MKTLLYAAAVTLFPFAAAAHDGMTVKDAYARGANPKSGAVFMILENHRTVDCTLKAANSDAAERVELHTSVEKDGVMKMQPFEGGLTIPAGGEYQLKRNGGHVMLLGLHAPLKDGGSIKLALDFGDCGIENIVVPVDNKRQADEHSHGHDHGEHKGH